jgi:hypothetical protein
MSAAFDFAALSPPFLRNLVDAHIFPPISEWTDGSLNRAEQLYAKNLAQVRDTLKDSDKQSSHVRSNLRIRTALSAPQTIPQVNVRDELDSSPSPVPQDAVSPDDPRSAPFI